jgi:hypothetical protein
MISVTTKTHFGQKSPSLPEKAQISTAITFTSAYWSASERQRLSRGLTVGSFGDGSCRSTRSS